MKTAETNLLIGCETLKISFYAANEFRDKWIKVFPSNTCTRLLKVNYGSLSAKDQSA